MRPGDLPALERRQPLIPMDVFTEVLIGIADIGVALLVAVSADQQPGALINLTTEDEIQEITTLHPAFRFLSISAANLHPLICFAQSFSR